MTAGRVAAIVLAAAVLGVAALIGGVVAIAYAAVYVVATLPGWPIGFALFGRRHPAGWIAGALLGYGMTAIALWLPIALHLPGVPAFASAWVATTSICWMFLRGRTVPAVSLPAWTSRTTVSLCAVVLLVPLLVALPYNNIGERDAEGNRRYRAYFTADFVWHEALTAELARFSSPPRNPYLGGRSLHYYWAYFLLPAVVTGAGHPSWSPPIETYLATNALCTGTLFLAAIYLAAWSAVPRAVSAAIATGMVVLAASAEGLYAAIDLLWRGHPLSHLRSLNVDAITSWYFQGLTIDGLPRSIWYNPQHSFACGLGLIALTISGRATGPMPPFAAAAAGLSLGLAFIVSPFAGGTMVLIYTAVLLWQTAVTRGLLSRTVVSQIPAAALVLASLAWCVTNKTFEGAGRALVIGLSERAATAPGVVLGLALGPILVLVVGGSVAAARARFPQELRPGAAGTLIALALLFFVTLSLEPIWIGWRAGQILLVTCPPLVALAIERLRTAAGRATAIVAVGVCALAGLPTTVIDHYNAQDTTNVAMGAGFRWTVVIAALEEEALRWIELHTPADAVVQMSLAPRGRETWSLIPSFARRRMAAGLPISLLRTPDYAERARMADAIFASGNAPEAYRMARALRVDYLYVGAVEREAFGDSLRAFDARGDLFERVFGNAAAAVYRVR